MTKRLTIFYQNARMIYLLTAKIQTPVCLLSYKDKGIQKLLK